MFNTKDNDNYETPNDAWDLILKHIPHDRVIYEPFYCTGHSGEYIRSKGFEVVHEESDFFQGVDRHYDMIVSNPPYSIRPAVFENLHALGKPWAMLVPLTTLSTLYFQKWFGDGRRLQVVMPNKRVQFLKGGSPTKKCNFDVAWLCWDLALDAGLTF